MDEVKQKSERSSITSSRKIELTENDPLKRLKEFCSQGKYHFKINWDRFNNGFVCECTVYYNLKRKSVRPLKKEVYWVETNDLQEAKKTIAAIFLDGIGLGVPDPKGDTEELIRMGTEALTGIVSSLGSRSWSDMVDEEN